MAGKFYVEFISSLVEKSNEQKPKKEKAGGEKSKGQNCCDDCRCKTDSNKPSIFWTLVIVYFAYLLLCTLEPVEKYYKPVGNLTAREWVGTNNLDGWRDSFLRPYTTDKLHKGYEIVKAYEELHSNQRLENPDFYKTLTERFKETGLDALGLTVLLIASVLKPLLPIMLFFAGIFMVVSLGMIPIQIVYLCVKMCSEGCKKLYKTLRPDPYVRLVEVV